jgi:L-methionine (R)-S-oxide reductase
MRESGCDSIERLNDLLDETDEAVTTLANASALLFGLLNHVNWVGFYLLKDGSLFLGPFQGKPACARIPAGKGVCGAAIAQDRTLRVDDVRAFPGHIACDNASRSELVVILRGENGKPLGVLDIDSPQISRFSERDQSKIERAVEIIGAKVRQKLKKTVKGLPTS